MVQALKDLARGEQTASALETNLTSLESRLDELLASFGILPEDEESNLPDDDDGEQHENGDQKTTLNGKEADAPPKKGDS
ncbi:hypothetical protein QBC44DRAFT_330182 [Cladorrhinum sp. PSN332]|nr:hypothetical protein QBC44DRAFT_330182 [Cladorrhinum sp. PSN332]